MEDNKDLDLKEESETPSAESTENNEPTASEGVTTPEPEPEVTDDEVQQMLADGTPASKEIRVPYEKFQEKNEKAKLYDSFAPLLAKLNEKPELLDQLSVGEKPIEEQVRELQEERLKDKRTQMETTIRQAISRWSDFREKWQQVQPLVAGLERQGVPYAEAVERAYFAVNPDALAKTERLKANDVSNSAGVFRSTKSYTPQVQRQDEEEYRLSDADRDFARQMGIDPKLYTKHRGYISKFDGL